MDVVVCVPAQSLNARRDWTTCIDWCNAEGWQITATARSRADAERALAEGTAQTVVVAREAHRRKLRGLPVLAYSAPARRRAPAAALPLIWLGERVRDHPVVAAVLAGTVAGVVAWWLLPGPEPERVLLPPPPVVEVNPSPAPSPSSAGPEVTGRPDPPAAAGPTIAAAPPDDLPAAPAPAAPPLAEPAPSSAPSGSPSPSNRPPEQLPTPAPEPVCILRLDLLGIRYSVCLPGQL